MSLSNSSSNELSPSASFVVGPTHSANSSSLDAADGFVDRRSLIAGGAISGGASRSERRQFGSSHFGLSDDARELALAIDQYKLQHHRRYLTCDEMLAVVSSLGYSK